MLDPSLNVVVSVLNVAREPLCYLPMFDTRLLLSMPHKCRLDYYNPNPSPLRPRRESRPRHVGVVPQAPSPCLRSIHSGEGEGKRLGDTSDQVGVRMASPSDPILPRKDCQTPTSRGSEFPRGRIADMF
jgi:hypothetical protein